MDDMTPAKKWHSICLWRVYLRGTSVSSLQHAPSITISSSLVHITISFANARFSRCIRSSAFFEADIHTEYSLIPIRPHPAAAAALSLRNMSQNMQLTDTEMRREVFRLKSDPQHDRKRYILPHIYTMKYSTFWNAWEFRNETIPYYNPLYQSPREGMPNWYLEGRELYNALIQRGIRVRWEEQDRFPRGPRVVRGGTPIEDGSEDESVEREEEYLGAVKTKPARQRKRDNAGKQKSARRAPSEGLTTISRQRGPTAGAVENERRLADGKRPLGRPKKVQPDLNATKEDSGTEEITRAAGEENVVESVEIRPSPSPQKTAVENAAAMVPHTGFMGQTLAGPHMDRYAQPAPAKQKGAHTTGYLANLERETNGEKKRGRPLGVKNKPKPTPQGTTQDSTKLEVAGDTFHEAAKETGNRGTVDEDNIAVARSPAKRPHPD